MSSASTPTMPAAHATLVGGGARDEREEEQLPGGVRGREDAGDQPAVGVEPPVGDDRAEHQGHRPGTDADAHAQSSHSCQGWVIRVVRPLAIPTTTSAVATVDRTPKRSMKAAANGAVRP